MGPYGYPLVVPLWFVVAFVVWQVIKAVWRVASGACESATSMRRYRRRVEREEAELQARRDLARREAS